MPVHSGSHVSFIPHAEFCVNQAQLLSDLPQNTCLHALHAQHTTSHHTMPYTHTHTRTHVRGITIIKLFIPQCSRSSCHLHCLWSPNILLCTLSSNTLNLCYIWYSHNSDCEEYCLLECETVHSDRNLLTSGRNVYSSVLRVEDWGSIFLWMLINLPRLLRITF
jgi:hypothetical protein